MRRLPPVAALLLIVLARPAAATPGALDTSFSGNGIQTAFVGGAAAQAVAIDGQDRILVAGSTVGAQTDVAIARLLPRGALDRPSAATAACGSTSARAIARWTSRPRRTAGSSWSVNGSPHRERPGS